MSAYDDLRKALLTEQFGHPVPEWLPNAKYRAAAKERVREIEEQHQQRNDSREAS